MRCPICSACRAPTAHRLGALAEHLATHLDRRRAGRARSSALSRSPPRCVLRALAAALAVHAARPARRARRSRSPSIAPPAAAQRVAVVGPIPAIWPHSQLCRRSTCRLLPDLRRHRLRADHRRPRPVDLDRQGGGGALGPAHRRQPRVPRPGPVEHRRRPLLVVRVVRLAEPVVARTSRPARARRWPPCSPRSGCCCSLAVSAPLLALIPMPAIAALAAAGRVVAASTSPAGASCGASAARTSPIAAATFAGDGVDPPRDGDPARHDPVAGHVPVSHLEAVRSA